MSYDSAQAVIRHLQLAPHPEGGYFRRTHAADAGAFSCIYYLLTAETPRSRLHRNDASIIHLHHAGGSLDYLLLPPAAPAQRVTLGAPAAGEGGQLVVPGGTWKCCHLQQGAFALISEVVVPAFEWARHRFAQRQDVAADWPAEWPALEGFL
ncbi:MAG: cupin domain-containing protein [Pseudomonadota bacterium]|nr:cupin domain-containing protein [Pseudomonadota bacterium]